MIRGEDYDYVSIPTDLIPEILLRLPGKSMARFSCVSKLWLFILTRPRLLFVLEQVSGELLFFSSPHPQKNPYEKSSPVVAADFSHEVLSRHVARISWAFFGFDIFL
ncbi:unnamed protein product [Brassica oleracea]